MKKNDRWGRVIYSLNNKCRHHLKNVCKIETINLWIIFKKGLLTPFVSKPNIVISFKITFRWASDLKFSTHKYWMEMQ